MKKLVLLVSFVSSSIIIAQITPINIEKCNKIAIVYSGSYDIESKKCGENKYVFNFRDANYSKLRIYRTFYFNDINEDYEYLFNFINSGFESSNEEIALELPDNFIKVKYTSLFGIKAFSIWSKNKLTGEEGRSGTYTKNQLYKLFGRTKRKES